MLETKVDSPGSNGRVARVGGGATGAAATIP